MSTSEPPCPPAHRIPLQTRRVGSSWLGGNGWKVRLRTHKGVQNLQDTKQLTQIPGLFWRNRRRNRLRVFQAWRKEKESKTKQSWERGLLLLTCLEGSGASSKGPLPGLPAVGPQPPPVSGKRSKGRARCQAHVCGLEVLPSHFVFSSAGESCCRGVCLSLFSWVLMSRVPAAPPGLGQGLEEGHLRARSCQGANWSVSWFTFRDPLAALQLLNCHAH